MEQIDDVPVLASYDEMNRLQQHIPGGAIRFAGSLNEQAAVTIESVPATVSGGQSVRAGVSVTSGTNQVEVKATDPAGNVRTNTYDVSVSGSSKTFTFDANGNMTGDGTRTFEWDAENRLIAVNNGTLRSEFSYDGVSRRVAIIEKSGENVLSSLHYAWCNVEICDERAPSGSVLTSFFVLGQKNGQDSFFYTGDHLRSVRELVDGSGVLQSRYEYEIYGERSTIEASVDTKIGFSGHYFHEQTGLILAPLRAYAPELGSWLSEDPAGTAHDSRYAYVTNNPTRYTDPLGLWKVDENLEWNPVTNPDMRQVCGLTPRDPRPGGGCAPLSSLRSYVTANCEEDCEGSWRAKDVTLHFKISLFLYAGDPSQFPTARDSRIRNSYDAGWHEVNAHIEPALRDGSLNDLLTRLENTPFPSEDECNASVSHASGRVTGMLRSSLIRSQRRENLR